MTIALSLCEMLADLGRWAAVHIGCHSTCFPPDNRPSLPEVPTTYAAIFRRLRARDPEISVHLRIFFLIGLPTHTLSFYSMLYSRMFLKKLQKTNIILTNK